MGATGAQSVRRGSRTTTGQVSTLVYSTVACRAQLVSDEAKFNGDTAFEHTSAQELNISTHAVLFLGYLFFTTTDYTFVMLVSVRRLMLK